MGKSQNSTTFRDFEKFPAAVIQSESEFINTDLATPIKLIMYKDSLLLVVNNLNRNPYHARVFDIGTKKAVANIWPVSGKPGGVLGFMSAGISNQLVWVKDITKNKFIVANIDSVLLNADAGPQFYSELYKQPYFYYDAILLNSNEALLSGNYDTDERLCYKNFSDSSKNKILLSYLKDDNIGASRVKKMAYQSFMLLKPDRKRVILACMYADEFGIFDMATGNYKIIKGPEGFSPDLRPYKNKSGVVLGTHGDNTRYGYLSGYATNDAIYLLFSGHQWRSSHQFYGKKIYVYNWEGKPLKELTLKNDVIDLVVSSDNKTLYTLNPRTGWINVSTLK